MFRRFRLFETQRSPFEVWGEVRPVRVVRIRGGKLRVGWKSSQASQEARAWRVRVRLHKRFDKR